MKGGVIYIPVCLGLYCSVCLMYLIHKYSCCFSQSSVFVSWVGAWAKIWNLIFFRSWLSSLMCFIIGPLDKCSVILYISGLVV